MREHSRFEPLLLALFILVLGIFNALGQGQSSNNLPGDAILLQPGQAVQDSINTAGETHYFLLPVDIAGIISISVDGVPGDMKPHITLSNEYFGLWISAIQADKTATNAGDSLSLEKDMPGPGGCYITVSDADGKAHNEPYSLNVDFRSAPDANEPNDLPGKAVVVKPNQEVKAYICPSNELDYYRLDINTSGILALKVDDVPVDMKPHIKLMNEYYMLWVSSDIGDKTGTNAGEPLTFEKDLLGPSGYLIVVSDADGKAHSDPYTLTFAFEPAPDNYEPNNDIGDAAEVNLDESITGYVCPGDDKDFYKLYMDSPGVVVLKVDGVPEDMRPYLVVRDKNNRQIDDKSATNPGDSLTLEKDLGAGWNYIGITDADGKAHSQPYTLKVSLKSGEETSR